MPVNDLMQAPVASVNRYCPRSGKPVQRDSLTSYRGVVVGFCNPGCRDDFASNRNDRPDDRSYFNTLIKEHDLKANQLKEVSEHKPGPVNL